MLAVVLALVKKWKECGCQRRAKPGEVHLAAKLCGDSPVEKQALAQFQCCAKLASVSRKRNGAAEKSAEISERIAIAS
jgi:hypothetical protein